MDRNLELQAALLTRLTGDALIMAEVSGVYDHNPQGVAFPYISIGEGTSTEDDTQTYTGTDNTIVIHVWSRYAGRSEAKRIQALIYDSLHRLPLTLSSGNCWEMMWQMSEVILDADGETRHGVSRYRIMTVR